MIRTGRSHLDNNRPRRRRNNEPDAVAGSRCSVLATLGGGGPAGAGRPALRVGVPLTDRSPADALVAETGVDGVFLQGLSTASAVEPAVTMSRWAESTADVNPWVAADQEGGSVQTLSGRGFAALSQPSTRAACPPTSSAPPSSPRASTSGVAPVVDVVSEGTEGSNAPIGAYGRR